MRCMARLQTEVASDTAWTRQRPVRCGKKHVRELVDRICNLMIKVLLLSHTCMSRTAGQPKLHALAEFADIDLTVLVPDRMCTYDVWHKAETPENAKFRYEVGGTRWHYIKKQWYLMHYKDTLRRLLREIHPDIIDLWEEPWGMMCAQAIRAAKQTAPNARILVETEQNIYKKLQPPFQQFQDYSLKNAEFCVARNREAVDVLRRKGYHGPASVVGNAVDCELFQPMTPAARLAQRKNLGWGTAADFLVGYVGRLVPEKGLADALNAVAKLPDNAKLIFVGDGPMRAELETLAQNSGLASRVVFAGNKPLTELPEIMNVLDVLVLPSHTTPRWKEQFGRVLIEAGACGTAVVGSDSGAIPEVIEDGGLVFPEGDVEAFAERLKRLQSDPDLKELCGRSGLRRANDLYSWQRVAEQMRDIYYEMTGGAPNAAARE